MKRLLLCCTMLALASPALARTLTIKLPTVTVKSRVLYYTHKLPAPQFDVPYMGELRIWRVASEKDMREFSNGISFGETGIALASSRVSKDLKHCDVYIVNDNMLKRYNASYSGELRHELGHCNGWTQKHEGGKTVQVSKEVEVKLPPGTQTLRAYPPLVCLTPDGKEEPCNDRGKKSFDQMIGFTTRDPWNYK